MTYDEMSYNEKMEIEELFGVWLKPYVNEVIIRVLRKKDEIIENEFAMNLLRELAKREEQEEKSFYSTIGCYFDNVPDDADFHLHPLQHSKSYRDVLYDMYIGKER